MDWMASAMLRNRYIRPIQEVSADEQTTNVAKFSEDHAETLSMLTEIRDRMPWRRGVVDDLTKFVKNKGKMSAKQRMFITSMYIDNCAMSDMRVREQIATRKLMYRLLQLGTLGKVKNFVYDVSYRTDSMPFSPNQIKALQRIAERSRQALADIPELDDTHFDGWFKIEAPKPEVIAPDHEALEQWSIVVHNT